MTPEQFNQVYPILFQWISSVLDNFKAQARPVSAAGFQRLPQYYQRDVLDGAQFVIVPRLPMPPLSQMGLHEYSAFENGDFAGITYLNTFFVKQGHQTESLFFHELVHVIQWSLLGPEKFLAAYAAGLEQFSYAASPLEAMAYGAQHRFDLGKEVFDVVPLVKDKLAQMGL